MRQKVSKRLRRLAYATASKTESRLIGFFGSTVRWEEGCVERIYHDLKKKYRNKV